VDIATVDGPMETFAEHDALVPLPMVEELQG